MVKAVFVSSLILFMTTLFCSCEKVICTPKSNATTTTTNNNDTPVIPSDIKTWTSVPSPTTNTLLDILFVDGNTGYISGNNGTILKTTDGGATWNILTSGVTVNLRSIYMFNANNGFIVGENGVLLKTTNGGNTWQESTMPGNLTLNKITFVNSTIGFIGATGGTLFKTTDGGLTWNTITSGSSCSIYDIVFLDNQNGYLCGQCSYIAKTTDGGNTWIEQSSGITSKTPSDLILKIKFADDINGFAIGEQISGSTVYDTYIISTKDGGQHWTRGNYPFNNITLGGIGIVNHSTAFVVGGDVSTNTYYILKTTDGQHWNTVSSGAKRLANMFLLNGSSGFSVGLDGIILRGN